MPIDVTCSKCHTRFRVSDKFAGKEGPCPKCKATIQVPQLDEQVVVHAPESFGPKTRSGEAVLKPISRKDTKIRPLTWVIVGVTVITILTTAYLLRDPKGGQPAWLLGLGSVLVALPVARLGYAFLRDDELEAFSGQALWVRVAIVSLLYAATWAGFTWLPGLIGFDTLDIVGAMVLFGIMTAWGTAVAYFAFDFDVGPAFFHFVFYLGVTIGLRMLMALSLLPVPIES